MKTGTREMLGTFLVMVLAVSPGLPQTRRTPRRPEPARASAPFLKQAKSYEETAYVTRVALKNGVTALVNEFRAHPVVSILSSVNAGYLEEPPHSPGIAALTAAMVCRGAPDKLQGTLRRKIQALGGLLRCSTDYRNARFEILVPASQWKKALEIQKEALFNPSLEPEDVRLEAGLLADETRGMLDEPGENMRAALLELAFGDPRMRGWAVPPGGVPSSLTPENIGTFHKAMYVPDRILLVVSGDVSSGEVLNEVARLYGTVPPARETPSVRPLERRQKGFRYRAVEGGVPLASLLFGFHVGPADSKDRAALEVLSAMIGTGEGSILALRLRDQKKLIFAQETVLDVHPDWGWLTIRLDVKPESIDRSEIALMTELELLKRADPDEVDMERAVAQLERAYWAGLETVTGRARALERFETAGGWKLVDRYIPSIRGVKPGDVRRVAAKYLTLENCSLVEYLPAAGAPRRVTADNVRRTLEGLLVPSTDQEQAERDREVVPALKIPATKDNFKFSEIRYPFQLASILRGPDMVVREDHINPLIEMGVFFPGGGLAEDEGNCGITRLMTRVIARGPKDKSSAQFYRQLEVYGGQVMPVVTADYFGYRFSILSRNFEAGLGLLFDLIKTPAFDGDEISRQKELQLQEILLAENSPAGFREQVYRALFPNSAYGLSPTGTPASLAAVTSDSLQKWYDNTIRNRKPVVVVVGDTQGTSLASHFVRHFSGSRMQDAKIPDEYVRELEKGLSIRRNWKRNQSLILIGFQAPPEDDEDKDAAAVLSHYAGEYGRLGQEARERRGVAYRVSVHYEPRLRGGSMIVSAAANPGNEEAVLKTLQEEIRQWIGAPIPYRDYRAAVTAALGSHWIRSQARADQIADMAANLIAGKGMDAYLNYPADIQQVGEEDLADAAKRILDLDKAVILRIEGTPVSDR